MRTKSIFGRSVLDIAERRAGLGEFKRPTKDAAHVLTVVCGPEEAARLCALPDSHPDRQAALAEAALAGEVVGDALPIAPSDFAGLFERDVQ